MLRAVAISEDSSSPPQTNRMDFTDEQTKVLAHPIDADGVLQAGPGTGKSLTVVALAQLLSSSPGNPKICFLTFTRAATAELARKIASAEAAGLRPSTIHSFAASVLMQNQDALPVLPLRIPSDTETTDTIYSYLRWRLKISNTEKIKQLVRSMASMWQSLEEENPSDFTPTERAQFTAAFNEAVRLFRFTLLDQLPDLLRHLINEHEDAKGVDIGFMIVDEYQDLNKCEIELLRQLRKRGVHILAVGDEDQSIYSWRKAHPIGIREFHSTFPEALIYNLSVCHRCPENMLDWAQHVIQQDLDRSLRPLPTPKKGVRAAIRLLHFKSQTSEANGVSDLIATLVNHRGFPPHEIMVLTRSDRYERFTKEIKGHLVERGIPVFDILAKLALFEDENAKRLFAMLRLIDNPRDSLAWYTLLALEPGIGRTTLEHLRQEGVANALSFADVLQQALRDGRGVSNKRLAQTCGRVQAKIDSVLAEQKKKSEPQVEWGAWIAGQAMSLIGHTLPAELIQVLRDVDAKIESDEPKLGYYLSQVVPVMKDLANNQGEGVRFMTISKSKGLTARATFVVGVDADLIPSPRNRSRNEELRLLYVAMTRAEKCLVMTWATRRRGSQARSGTANVGKRRSYTEFLQHGKVPSESGEDFVSGVAAKYLEKDS